MTITTRESKHGTLLDRFRTQPVEGLECRTQFCRNPALYDERFNGLCLACWEATRDPWQGQEPAEPFWFTSRFWNWFVGGLTVGTVGYLVFEIGGKMGWWTR